MKTNQNQCLYLGRVYKSAELLSCIDFLRFHTSVLNINTIMIRFLKCVLVILFSGKHFVSEVLPPQKIIKLTPRKRRKQTIKIKSIFDNPPANLNCFTMKTINRIHQKRNNIKELNNV